MTEENTKAPLTSSEKKARYRNKMRSEGYKEISVWVSPDQAQKVKDFAAKLPKPKKKKRDGQPSTPDLFSMVGQSDE